MRNGRIISRQKLEVFTYTGTYAYWKGYMAWISRVVELAHPVLLDLSLTLSRVSDDDLSEVQLEEAMRQDFGKLFAALATDKELTEFKLYIDQHPLRQRLVTEFLRGLCSHAESLQKLHFNQVALKKKHIDLLERFKQLRVLDIEYCVLEKDASFGRIGGSLNEFYCKDVSNLIPKQLVELMAYNRHIWSLSFCAEEYKAEDICQIIGLIDPIRKLRISHAYGLDSRSFQMLKKEAAHIEKLELKKVSEATNIDFGSLLSTPLLRITTLCLEECEHLDTINVEVLADNCPGLVELKLDWSIHVGDVGVQAVLQKLLKLRTLGLVGLKKLSNACFEYALALPTSALKGLKRIDVTQCNGVQDSVLKAILMLNPYVEIKNYYGETNAFWNDYSFLYSLCLCFCLCVARCV